VTLLELLGAALQWIMQHKVQCMQERIDYSLSATCFADKTAHPHSVLNWKSERYYKHVEDLAENARIMTRNARAKAYRAV